MFYDHYFSHIKGRVFGFNKNWFDLKIFIVGLCNINYYVFLAYTSIYLIK